MFGGIRGLEEVKRLIPALENIVISVNNYKYDDKTEFSIIFNTAQVIFGLSQAETAKWFHLSRATVNRWSTGETVPYVGLRKVVLDQIAKRAGDQLRALRRHAGSIERLETKRRERKTNPLPAGPFLNAGVHHAA